MTLPKEVISQGSQWLTKQTPCNNIVVSSRTRYARNLHDHPFSPHASPGLMERVRGEVSEAFSHNKALSKFFCLELTEVSGTERAFLKESRLISKEMERGGPNRAVYVAPDLKASIMINEEDHIRVQCLEGGLQVSKAQDDLTGLDEEISRVIAYAFHEKFGYLTACPTNVGTGLRASVMMHLPGMTLRRNVEHAFQGLAPKGLTVRGFHGENSEHLGDCFQISNEVTLGKSVEEIEETLVDAVNSIMEKESEARSLLLSKGGMAVQDTIWRSFGVLLHARKIDTAEAMKLLSRVRLGIDEGYLPSLKHETLNRLMMEIQPSHLVLKYQATDEVEQRDVARATLIRETLGGTSSSTKKAS